jgi:antirestriction protein ArdC
MKKPTKDFIYEQVNQAIIKQLEQGSVPWRMPWKTDFPVNLVTKKEYNGYNWWILMIDQMVKHYESNVWATFKQIAEAGGAVKKGEKSTMVVFWKIMEFQSKDKVTKGKNKGKNKVDSVPLLRYYNVFNIDQTVGIELKNVKREFTVNDTAQWIITNFKSQLNMQYGGNQAFYNQDEDYIMIPDRHKFTKDEDFYAVHFHEMIHATGHPKRLGRFKEGERGFFGDEDYSKEELIAEMGSAYLCARSGILPKTIENSGAYIANWLKVLNDDKSLLVSAGGKAHKAAEFIMKNEVKE